MKVLKRLSIVWIVLLVSVVLCVLFSSCPNVALAAQNKDISIVDNAYYLDCPSLDTTAYYREYAVTNREVTYEKSGDIFAFENGASVVKNDLNTLVFKLNLLKPEYEKDKIF